jgi:4,5-dihydroxyphthalate decarboxylase
MQYPPSGPVVLKTNLGDHAGTAALKRGDGPSELVTFDFCGPKTANEGFKPMIREGFYQAGELAIVSYLQAKVYGKPLVLLPAVVLGGFLHHCIRYNPAHGAMMPRDIEGAMVGTRVYTQTTCVWVRGVLQEEYGVDLSRVTWGVADESHLAEYQDPPNCRKLPPGRKLEDLLGTGEIVAAVVSPQAPPDPQATELIPDAHQAAQAWGRKRDLVPINHMVVVDQALSEQRPDVVRDIWRMLLESKRIAGETPAIRFGIEPNRKALELVIDYAVSQQIIPRRFHVDDLFDDTTRALTGG